VTRLRARMKRSLRLRCDRRGVTLLELLVALVVIATATFGTTIAYFTAYGSLQEQRHRMRANDILRAEIEYWHGRIHAGHANYVFPTSFEMQQPTDWKKVTIDPRGPGTQDDIVGFVRRDPIGVFDDPETKQSPDYYIIAVVIRWVEPPRIPGGEPYEIFLHLESYWIEAVQ